MIITSHLNRFPGPLRRPTAALVAAFAVVMTGACDDPFAPRASTSVRTDSFVVYAVSQTPVNVPAAFNIVFFTTLRLEPTYGFDIVFDIDETGKAVIIPARLIGGAVTSQRQVGLQKIVGNYADMTRAPELGYLFDESIALTPDEGVVIQLQAQQCNVATSRVVYAKLQIQAVDPVSRRIAFRITYDPNCGFRSFLPGVPTN